MKTQSKFLAHAEIRGKKVSFYSPPHSEPDFPWCDVEELAAAFLDDEVAAKRMVQLPRR